MSIFTVEIVRFGEFGRSTSAILELPATSMEYSDAMQKARIIDDMVIYSYEFLYCKHDWLRPHIPENGNLLELNLLATRMEYIKDDLDIFKAIVKMDAEQNSYETTPLSRLINLTLSIDNCHVASGIKNDVMLGEFLYEGDFIEDKDADMIERWRSINRPVDGLFELLGKVHRERRGGVFTDSGLYVEYDSGMISEVYIPGEMHYISLTEKPVALTLSKDYFNDPGYDNNLQVTLNLPATDKEIINTIDTVAAASFKEITYSCKDCLIPIAKEWIDNAQDLWQVNKFAKALDYIKDINYVKEYKALLEAADCDNLNDALHLTDDIEVYQLVTECAGPEDYGWEEFTRQMLSGNIPEGISEYIDYHRYGKALMEKNNVVYTSYGALSRTDGGPILSQTEIPGMNMEMR